jgi:TolA-binding protein
MMLHRKTRFQQITMRKHGTFIVCAFILMLLVPVSSPKASGAPGSGTSSTAKDLLKKANYYYSVDDITDRASDTYRELLTKYPKSPEAEQAQFYLGLYFHKKFYCLRSKGGKVDAWSVFNEAERALNTYNKNYSSKGTGAYLADSYFVLAMIYLQRGSDTNRQQAASYLDSMATAASRDRSVFIQDIVWTPNAKANLNVMCDARKLASAGLASMKRFNSFDQLVDDLRNWCRTNCGAQR